MNNIRGRLNKLKKEVLLSEANYRVQKIIKNCENCRYMRLYNGTCSKNNIRVSKKYGMCNHFEVGSFFDDWIDEIKEENKNG